jgi:hypothetical protein
MRSPQAHEVKAQITEFLAKVKTDMRTTVIRHNKGDPRSASPRGRLSPARGKSRGVNQEPTDCGQSLAVLLW